MRQVDQLREHFDSGGRLTVGDALDQYGIYALSQRAGELQREGYPVESRFITLPNGKRIKQYYKATQLIERAA